MTGLRVVVAPDKFKGSLTAVEAADAIGAGVRDVLPDARVTASPMADGGEGTLDVLLAAGGRRVEHRVRGPLDEQVDAWYVLLEGTAYVESARACGIEHVQPSPQVALAAHTYGVGELIAHALAHGARSIVLTVGGTAGTDGGAGMLQALGARVLDTSGAPVGLGGGALAAVHEVDLGPVRARLGGAAPAEVRVATDVTNPLLGPDGAAAVFGPQKGARPEEVARLEDALRSWSDALVKAGCEPPGELAGAGAGGGVSAGAIAGLGARVEAGFDLVLHLTGLQDALADADLVITGEGSLDAQSLAGKVPAGIAHRAAGVPVLAVAGRVSLDEATLAGAGIVGCRTLIDHAPSLEYATANAFSLVREQSAALLRDWLAK